MGYETVPVIPNNEKANQATETIPGNLRTKFNTQFSPVIKSNAGSNNTVYDAGEHESKLNYETGSEFGYMGASVPINGVAKKYEMKATTKGTKQMSLTSYQKLVGVEIVTGTTADGVEYQSEVPIYETWYYMPELANLGLFVREQPDLALTKDLKTVQVSINGKDHIYEYDSRYKEFGDEGFENDTKYGVQFQDKYGKRAYTRAIRKADAEFTSQRPERELVVYATYRIEYINQSTELKARVNSIADYYDKRFELNDVEVGEIYQATDERITVSTAKGTTFTNAGTTGNYNKILIDTSMYQLEPRQKQTIYIRLKLTRETINTILETNDENGIENIAEINSYTVYDSTGALYAGIDKNSEPGNCTPGVESTYEDDTDSAPGFKIVEDEERTLGGTVFEDNVSVANNIRQGNGELDSSDSGRISSVEVELLRKEYDSNNGEYWKIITTGTTDNSGKYSFSDYAAGDYIVRYTWGNTPGDRYKFMAQNYKATIFDDSKHNDSNKLWYRQTTAKGAKQYSDATDFYEPSDVIYAKGETSGQYADQTRLEIDKNYQDINYATKDTEEHTERLIKSVTPEMNIKVEYDDNNGKENTDGTGYVYPVEEIDFGIAERARQHLMQNKEASHIKVSLKNEQVFVDADLKVTGSGTNTKMDIDGTKNKFTAMPRAVMLNPEKWHEGNPPEYYDEPYSGRTSGYPNGFAKLEVDNETLQGLEIEITYTITVTNTSERDYIDPEFYKSGRIPSEDTAVKLDILKIVDYLDKELTFNKADYSENVDNKWEAIETINLKDEVDPSVYDISSVTNTIGDKKILWTDKLANSKLKAGDSASIKLIVTKTLATTYQEDEMEYVNEAEVIKIHKDGGSLMTIVVPGNYQPGSGKQVEPDDDISETFIITPSTGGNLNFILPIVGGIIALLVLSGGIVIIKTKVVGKKFKRKIHWDD